MILSKRPALFFLFVLALVRNASADFEIDDVEGTYKLELGSTSDCPDKLKFEGSDDKITSEQMSADGSTCTGNDITLSENGKNVNTYNLSDFLLENEEEIGSFLSGSITTGDINCNERDFSISASDSVSFFEPDDDVEISWRSYFGSNSDKPFGTEEDDDEFTFDDGDKYFVVSDRCVYKKTVGVCFHGQSTVRLSDGSLKLMRVLETGDAVVSDVAGRTSAVMAWTHKGEAIKSRFVNATTSYGSLVATTGHFVYAAKDGRTELVRMNDLSVGMSLVHASGNDAPILSLSKFMDVGVWNPQTESGSIVVDGFVASCYTESLSPNTAHALLSPVRAVFNAGFGYLWNMVAETVTGGFVSAWWILHLGKLIMGGYMRVL